MNVAIFEWNRAINYFVELGCVPEFRFVSFRFVPDTTDYETVNKKELLTGTNTNQIKINERVYYTTRLSYVFQRYVITLHVMYVVAGLGYGDSPNNAIVVDLTVFLSNRSMPYGDCPKLGVSIFTIGD